MAVSVMVTGGAGFLGGHVLDAVQKKHWNWKLTALDIQQPPNPRQGVEYRATDLLCQDAIEDAVATVKPEVVIHCASLVPPLDKRFNRKMQAELLSINVEATKMLIQACKGNDVKAFVFTGSCSAVMDDLRFAYRNIDETYPLSFSSLTYGESKALAEQLVLDANSSCFPTCVLRPSVLIGPGDYQIIPALYACIGKGETPFMLGNGNNLWDVSYAPNVADAHVLAVENLLSTKTAAGEAFFIQNNEPITFRDLCLEVWKNFNHFPAFEIWIPSSMASFAGYVRCVFHGRARLLVLHPCLTNIDRTSVFFF